MTICSFCQSRIFADAVKFGTANPHHTDADAWRQSVLSKCRICTILHQRARHLVASGSKATLRDCHESDYFHLLGQCPIYDFIIGPNSAGTENDHNLIFEPRYEHRAGVAVSDVKASRQIFFCHDVGDEQDDDSSQQNSVWLKARGLGQTIFSVETTAQITRWIARCDKTRKCWKGNNNPSEQPTRLVDVGSDGSSRVKLAKVGSYKTDPSDSGLKYATLSHCWGSKPMPVTLTMQNYDKLHADIPYTELPRNFQDAVVVARKLKIQYIWIDSLCIIQYGDGRADWNREAPRMSEYYRGAYCSIAAANSVDFDGGLARIRNVDDLMPAEVGCEWDYLDQKLMVVRDDFWEGELLAEPLYQRGWVFQERMLATRILHFGKDQVSWQCSCLTACETFPNGFPSALNYGPTREAGWRRLFQETKRPSDSSRTDENPRALWRSFVEDYTRCDLTFQSDKLMAIAGVAKQITVKMGDLYIAGLWRSSLRQGLAWRTRDTKLIATDVLEPPDAEHYRAPSWAWPSVDGAVRMSMQQVVADEDWQFQVDKEGPKLDYREPKNAPYGSLVSGRLSVRARLYALPFVPSPRDSTHVLSANYDPTTRYDMSLHLDRWPANASTDETTLTLLVLHGENFNTQGTGQALALQRVATRGDFMRIGLVQFRSIDAGLWDSSMITSAEAAGSESCDYANMHSLTLI